MCSPCAVRVRRELDLGVLPTPTERVLSIGPPLMPGSQCVQGRGREGPQEQRRGTVPWRWWLLGEGYFASFQREVSDGPVPAAAEASSQPSLSVLYLRWAWDALLKDSRGESVPR